LWPQQYLSTVYILYSMYGLLYSILNRSRWGRGKQKNWHTRVNKLTQTRFVLQKTWQPVTVFMTYTRWKVEGGTSPNYTDFCEFPIINHCLLYLLYVLYSTLWVRYKAYFDHFSYTWNNENFVIFPDISSRKFPEEKAISLNREIYADLIRYSDSAQLFKLFGWFQISLNFFRDEIFWSQIVNK
jgi:hypothetical protein